MTGGKGVTHVRQDAAELKPGSGKPWRVIKADPAASPAPELAKDVAGA
jgi:hypothetical protein